MTGKGAQQKKKSFGLPRPAGHKFLIVVFMAMFLLGYNLTLSQIQPCSAQISPPGALPPNLTQLPGPPAPPNVGVSACPAPSCEPAGTSAGLTEALIADFLEKLDTAAVTLETFLWNAIILTLNSEYDQLIWLEREMISWWQTMWYYNLLPGLQNITRELNVAIAMQALQLESNADVTASLQTDLAFSKHGIEDHAISPGEQVCVAATAGGGFTRSTAFSKEMRLVWEQNSVAAGLNDTALPGNPPPPPNAALPGASSAAGTDQKRYHDWQDIFCDPQSNGGMNVPCGASVGLNPPLYNADVLPVKYLFNNLTIAVDNTNPEGQQQETAVEDLIDNMVGVPAMDAIIPSALSSPTGRQGYMMRRSYLARYAAVRSVPDMIAGWRMPGSSPAGSQMGQFIDDLRESGDIPVGSTSKDPSYKEVMHALSVDRFNSIADPNHNASPYAMGMMTDPTKVEMEKLDLSVFYLMQLRDYYELLERTALTLAVQVSLLTDQQSMSNANATAPTQ
jgi:hypothetical protein